MFKQSIMVIALVATATAAFGGTMSVKEPTQAMSFEAGKHYTATIKTEKGDIVVDLKTQEAPFSTTNFIQLANADFYKGLTFHPL